MNVIDKNKPEPDALFLVNPYRDWTEAQHIPVFEGFALDMLACETKPWGFTEANGAPYYQAIEAMKKTARLKFRSKQT